MKNNKYDYDVIYIGSGHAAFDGAKKLCKKGFKIAFVEADAVGGTCPNWGCNAKITLDLPITLAQKQHRMNGIVEGDTKINWHANMQNKHAGIDNIKVDREATMKSLGMDVIHGFAKFSDAHTLEINGEHVTADKIVIATGLTPHKVNVENTELSHDSKDFLNLDEMPKSMAIVGTGYIAMEFATMANEAGCDVTMLMHSDKALRGFYQPYVEKVINEMKASGINFIQNADIHAFNRDSDNYIVNYGDKKELNVAWILDASGRIPMVHNMGLEDVGVKYDERKGIIVNDHLQTSVDNIYASGDVAATGQPKLTPTATFESQYLNHLFSGETDKAIDFPAIPSVVFTSPRISQMGVSVAEAEQSDKYTVEKHDMAGSWFRQATKAKIAENAYVFDKEHRLVGFTEISDDADNTIDTLVPAVNMHMNEEEIERNVHLFPSIGHEAWKNL
ncbi:NAD(P)/FAD-dependent oxidoreductase [Apilactobacillus micheneri]|uniref:NAD(P)/FAD-dependent oxidoreductase n=1 Tax=Apilactobacillus micheneri TaxID=1899430 RepID=A0ABY2YZK6_9LACO|nr:NAD(P)/FAD-dependent oxidoreductase [Apilactobacillus micheneri]TPR26492.1 NAD(P)/FAD-dependent oxidoreductase [Apilactobacillus micheneri]TPR27246.1 NAD(P)/FAD-dependent oxidoreductase [Apilactobacillus micheneri]TPR27493.1 NAD(P)/FAD-dependent oxidoreductase [Apilactobacillus micheneri]TPR32009.1 NAD(P)/FAD-dependent oxidoreductase [Apilactobacillus micheneri]TPR32413.1 NAD(P)/FAD-dependent oxidoreductase [Apilactobacillus micheneri]